MTSVIVGLSAIAGLAVLLLVVLSLIKEAVLATAERIEKTLAARKAWELGWVYQQRIVQLDRWCCWHFPIVEDVSEYLLSQGKLGSLTIDQFREHLKQKYGDREKGIRAV